MNANTLNATVHRDCMLYIEKIDRGESLRNWQLKALALSINYL